MGVYGRAYIEHVNLEEALLIPLCQHLSQPTVQKVSLQIKTFVKNAPGSTLALCLFGEVCTRYPELESQYRRGFPAFLRAVLIPTLRVVNPLYRRHRAIFG